jgi:hypothetical protein
VYLTHEYSKAKWFNNPKVAEGEARRECATFYENIRYKKRICHFERKRQFLPKK